MRATQLAPQASYRDTETRSMVTLSPGSEWGVSFPVLGGSTLELTFAQVGCTAAFCSLCLCLVGVVQLPTAAFLAQVGCG